MTELTKALVAEQEAPFVGAYAPFYLRYLGYKNNSTLPGPALRAKGVESLFSMGNPYVYANDLIVGNNRYPLVQIEHAELEEAQKIVDGIGSRSFITNYDHFAPNYRRFISSGIPGVIGDIDASIKKYADDERKILHLEAMKTAMSAFGTMIEKYADKAHSLMGQEGYDDERLTFVENNCRVLTERAPQSFAEALWLSAEWTVIFILYSKRIWKAET